ncbi:MAG TPA: histidinol-phosphatase [Aliidongia sp.]|uniref:histidinol-phosphatase n=1 Tax=Aliidongia sp. TaxID=1914230 RepID=UPI002DDD6AD4|nr:histidinol-phosphatase [Aliidongia sp.]HEV2675779.1 histidinol-phosphatase [Aliidongia sp.]
MTPAAPAVLDAAATLAADLADAAGNVVRRYFRQSVEIIDKDDASPVTIADREAEAAMRRLITQRFPDHGVLGEEHGPDRTDAEWVWVLDPIDGTKSFISGVPLFGTLIALLHQGRPVLGVLDQPISRERWLGGQGRPTTFNGQPVRARACADLARATIFSTTPAMFDAVDRPRFDAVADGAKLVRYGADCYAYGLVASGFVDAVIEGSLKPYDYCAHVPIIEGAGGIVTDWQGNVPGLTSDGRIIAAGDRALHARLVERLN